MYPFNLFTQNKKPALPAGTVILNPNYDTTGQYGSYNPFNIGQTVQGAPAPTPQPQTNNSVVNPTPTPVAQQEQSIQQPDAQSIVPSDEELNSIYDPAVRNLDLQYQSAVDLRDTELADINRESESSQAQLDALKSEQLARLDAEENELGGAKENAFVTARRVANELGQRTLSRFGTGSSAGGAISEIIGRETQRAFSIAETNFSKGYQQLVQLRNGVDNYYNVETRKIADTLQSGLAEIRRQFRDDSRQIEANRNLLASAKAEKKIDALQRAREQAYNFQSQLASYAQQLDLKAKAERTALETSIASYLGQLNQGITGVDESTANIGTGVNSLSRFSVGQNQATGTAPLTGYIRQSEDEDYLLFA